MLKLLKTIKKYAYSLMDKALDCGSIK